MWNYVYVLIDSGSSCNVMSKASFDSLKLTRLEKSEQKIFTYGATEPLPVIGTFKAMVQVGSKQV